MIENDQLWIQVEGRETISRGKKYRSEEIISNLREAEVLMSQGMTLELAAK